MIERKRLLATAAAIAALGITFSGTVVSKAMQTVPKASLHTTLEGNALWEDYKRRFIAGNGRVIDTANGNISHSEGQGYAMLLAVAANDRETFARVWRFARESLAVRDDALFAWRWKPSGIRRVPDRNNASDGDLLIAWALLEAADAGFSQSHTADAAAILASLKSLVRKDGKLGHYLMPAAFGFDRKAQGGRDVVNLSYWVFPAMQRIARLTGEVIWHDLARDGRQFLTAAMKNEAGLPADWQALVAGKGRLSRAEKMGASFSYNAVRVPLYLAWAQNTTADDLAPFRNRWSSRKRLEQISTRTGKATGRFEGPGYRAVAATLDCALDARRFPDVLRGKLDRHYYPASLQLLATVTIRQRYPKCW